MGEAAESQLRSNIKNTAVELPRLLGDVRFDEYPASRHLQKDGGKIEVAYDGTSVDLRPEQITAAIFTKLKGEMVSKYGGVGPCVVSVPASHSSGSHIRIASQSQP